MKLTEETKRLILESRLVLVDSNIPPRAVAQMDARYAVDLLENQRLSWYEPGEGPIIVTPELKKVFDLLDKLIADPTNNAHLVTEELYTSYLAYKKG